MKVQADMSEQDKLSALYQRFLDRKAVYRACGSLEAGEKMIGEIDGPFLIKTNAEYDESKPRVVIVGQETNGWLGGYQAFLQGTTIESAISAYEQFDFGLKYNSPFWQYFAEIRRKIFGANAAKSKRRVILWLNLFKFDQGCMMRSTHKEAVLQLQDDVFQQEIMLLRPDVIIFLTGPYYDTIIQRFYPGVQFKQIEGCSTRQVTQVTHERLPVLSFRTYHPGYMNRYKNRTAHCLPAIMQKVVDGFGKT